MVYATYSFVIDLVFCVIFSPGDDYSVRTGSDVGESCSRDEAIVC